MLDDALSRLQQIAKEAVLKEQAKMIASEFYSNELLWSYLFLRKNKILCTLIRNIMFDYRIDIKIYGYYMKMKKARWERAQLKDF